MNVYELNTIIDRAARIFGFDPARATSHIHRRLGIASFKRFPSDCEMKLCREEINLMLSNDINRLANSVADSLDFAESVQRNKDSNGANIQLSIASDYRKLRRTVAYVQSELNIHKDADVLVIDVDDL